MGDDGTIGCKLLKEAGARILTQDESSCVVYGMPRSVFEAGLSDHVAPLEEIADFLTKAVTAGESRDVSLK
jgi:two-component system chemotaxis response regulator CheB